MMVFPRMFSIDQSALSERAGSILDALMDCQLTVMQHKTAYLSQMDMLFF